MQKLCKFEALYRPLWQTCNKNMLEYAQIARNGHKSMICDIEGLSNKYE